MYWISNEKLTFTHNAHNCLYKTIAIYQQACNKHRSGTNKYIPRKMLTNNNKELDDGSVILYKTDDSNTLVVKED